ncbi:MAG: hypothetical protein ACFB9M_04370 [Myxococcota bacterium]
MASIEFRGRVVKPLAFGTSGLRGLVDDLTDLEVYVNVRGFLDFLGTAGELKPESQVYLGGDLRPSTDRLVRTVALAVSDAGHTPVHCGLLPTPALAAFAFHREAPAVMVTGSHIPFNRNGIKFYKSRDEVLKEDEGHILQHVQRHRDREVLRSPEASLFDDAGMLKVPREPLSEDDAAKAHYLDRYRCFFPSTALAGLRIALYAHSAVGRDLLQEILHSLGAEVVVVGRSDEFVPIDTEAVFADRLAEIQEMITPVEGRIDAVVSTDGDSDRPLVLGLEDGMLHFVPGELLGLLTARALGARHVAIPVSCSDATDRSLGPEGVVIDRTRIGSPWVIAAMKAATRSSSVMGWEANGGFLLGTRLEREGRSLEALPTRDAALPLVTVLSEAARRGCSVITLLRELPFRATANGLVDEFPREEAHALVRWLTDGLATPQAPAPSALVSTLRSIFKADLGFGPLQVVNAVDGARLFFEGGDVVHLRPSGNAPQLRIYAVSETRERVDAVIRHLGSPREGILAALLEASREHQRMTRAAAYVDTCDAIVSSGGPNVMAIVSGSTSAREFWGAQLAEAELGSSVLRSLHEDLPVNQAFGLLLLWQRLRADFVPGKGALAAFVFGDGTRSTPWTETDNGQKPAIATFVRPTPDRSLPMVELALKTFLPVEAFLRRSGFDGLVVKWGDEILIPPLALSHQEERFGQADVIRFVSMAPMTEDDAANKDWVGVDDAGRVTAFIPRRPLKEMLPLAEQGLLQERSGQLWGGINLGSIAISSSLLNLLLEEFEPEVLDPHADRRTRPDLDPQFFTALTIAADADPSRRDLAWRRACGELPAIRALQERHGQLFSRLRGVLERFEAQYGRAIQIHALDLQDPYWGDIGQHHRLRSFFMDLLSPSFPGHVARKLAGLPVNTDEHRNRFTRTVVSHRISVRGSVLIDCELTGEGRIENAVLIGTKAHDVDVLDAFDVESTVRHLCLAPGAGSYRVVAEQLQAGPDERVTSLFLSKHPELFRVLEQTDLKNKADHYDVPILGNPLSFREAHRRMLELDPEELRRRRADARAELLRLWSSEGS